MEACDNLLPVALGGRVVSSFCFPPGSLAFDYIWYFPNATSLFSIRLLNFNIACHSSSPNRGNGQTGGDRLYG